jgi:hypothetical protein
VPEARSAPGALIQPALFRRGREISLSYNRADLPSFHIGRFAGPRFFEKNFARHFQLRQLRRREK